MRECEAIVALGLLFGGLLPVQAQQTSVVSAVLPGSRAAQVSTTATAFATVINGGTVTATDCQIGLPTGLAVDFYYQATDAATNAPLAGFKNVPVTIGPGQAQSFLIAVTPQTVFAAQDIRFRFSCANAADAPVYAGVNTLLLASSATAGPDVVALAATVNGDGIVNVPGPTGTGFFAVASVNVGAGATITASANTGSAALPVGLSICQTNPATGSCLAAPSASVTTSIDAGATPTFAVFATGSDYIAFHPAGNRIFVVFRDAGGAVKGATSVAVRTLGTPSANVAPVANAGAAQNVMTGSTVILDGSGSSDANGDPLTYAWTFSSKPTGSAATLSGATTARPTFMADLAGIYVVNLVVNDGKVNGAPATVSVTAIAPFFSLGSPQLKVAEGAPVLTNRWGLLELLDLNGDGRDDILVTAGYYPPDPYPATPRPGYVALNAGDGQFRATDDEILAWSAITSVHAREFAVADLNKDGMPDLFIADHGYDAPPFPGFRNQLFLSQGGAAKWVDSTGALPGDWDFTHSVAVGDVDGDGNPDIFVGNFRLQYAYLLMGDGKGGFTKNTDRLPRYASPLPGSVEDVALYSSLLVDLDGDGRPELVLGTGKANQDRQIFWNINGSYSPNQYSTLGGPTNFGSDWGVMDIQSMDLNADGKQDLILVYQGHVWNGGFQFQVLINQGNRQFVDQTSTYIPDGSVVTTPVPTETAKDTWVPFMRPRDLNADGLMDLWITCQGWDGKMARDSCPVALIRQFNGTFKPLTVGALRSAGVPDYFFWYLQYSGNGPGVPSGHLVSVHLAVDNRPAVNSVPITFGR